MTYIKVNRLIIILIVLCMLLPAIGTSQPSKFDIWGESEGLPQSSVNSIIQSRDGYLWMGSEGGLIRFDGVKFTVYDVSSYPQLQSNRVLSIIEDKNNNILIGSMKGGLSIYHNNEIKNLSDSVGLKDLSIFYMYRDSMNRIWASTRERGTTVLSGTDYKKIPAFDILQDYTVYKVYEPIRGEYLLVCDWNFYYWKDNKLYPPSHPLLEAYPRNCTTSFYDSTYKCFWVISGTVLYKIVNHKVIEKYDVPTSAFNSTNTYDIFKTQPGKLIISLKGGVGGFSEFDIKKEKFSPLKDMDVNCVHGGVKEIFVDAERNIWYASRMCGLIKAKPQIFEYVDYRPGVKTHNIYPVIIDSKQRIVLGTNGRGIYILDSTSVKNYSTHSGDINEDFICTLLEAEPGTLYAGSLQQGFIYRIKDGVVKFLKMESGDFSGAKTLYKSLKGEIFIGGFNGLYNINGSTLTKHEFSKYFVKDNITSFYETDSTLWISSDLAIHEINKNRYKKYNIETGLKAKFFRGIYEDNAHNFYFGTYGYGLVMRVKDRFYVINSSFGLKDNVVSTITEDDKGNIWLTGNKGLSRIKKTELLDFVNGKKKFVNAILYDQTDGLISSEFNGGFQQAKCKVADNIYLFPTLGGCVKVDFNNINENKLPPPVKIEKVIFNDSSYLVSGRSLRMPYAKGRLEVLYTALSFVSPKNVRFKYRLEGYDDDWIDAGNERKTSYTKLPPGKYIFHVIASNNEGVWNNTGSSLAIVIVPPFYMTWWFRLASIVAVLVILAAIIAYYIKIIRTREANRTAFMNVLPDLLLRMNRQGKYIDFLGNKKELIQPFEELKGKHPNEVLPRDLADIISRYHGLALKTGEVQVFDYVLTHNNGKAVNYEGRMVAVNRSEVLYIIRDVTESKKAERELLNSRIELMNLLEQKSALIEENRRRQLERLNAIVETQEIERERIANDLHDGIAQMLSLVKINLSAIESAKENNDKKKQTIDATQKLIDSITVDLKNVSYNLMPSSLSKFGLVPALEELAERMQYNDEVTFRFVKHTTNQTYGQKIDINIYRIVQELINNTLKHAGATEMLLQIIEHDDTVNLNFENNGAAFDPISGQSKHESKGLKNIVSRIRTMRGTIHFDTLNEGEIVITLEVPINNENIITNLE